MENASKALLMAAGVLIAILLVSAATYLFKSASQVTKSYDKSMEINDIAIFNAHFTKFVGAVKDGSSDVQKYATIYDVISTANFADDYNRKNSLDPTTAEALADPTLVRVDLKSKDGMIIIDNLQNKPNTYDTLMQECYYQNNLYPNATSIVTYDIQINSENALGKINHVTFSPSIETRDTSNGLKKARDFYP